MRSELAMKMTALYRSTCVKKRMPMLYLEMVCMAALLLGCSMGGDEGTVPWDTDIAESEEFDGSAGTWSPDGRRIAFQHTDLDIQGEGPRSALWVYDLDTRERREIAPGPIIYPAWSPDGDWFVFQTTDPQTLWKISADGREAVPLTGSGSPNPDLRYTVVPTWHPSGDSVLVDIYAGDRRGLWIMQPDGTDARQILPYALHGSWFPNGERIAYKDFDNTLPRDRDEQIFVANADGRNVRRLTNLKTDRAAQPAVSPDGLEIAFLDWDASEKDGQEIFLMTADGENLRQITGAPGLIRKLEWSPDGRHILFDRWIPNTSRRLYLLDVETLEVEPLIPANTK